jgi:phosphatidate cytidylyltransferase
MSNLLVRALTSAVVVPIILVLLYWAPPWGFLLMGFAGAAVAASELVGMILPKRRIQQTFAVLAAVGVYSVVYYQPSTLALAATLIGLVVIGFIVGLAEVDPIETAGHRMSWLVTIPLYAGGVIATMPLMHALPNGGSWVVLAMVLAWFGDTGAYFAGKSLGKRKLYERVSPKKTVEGALGGLAGSVLGAVGVHFLILPELSLLHTVPLALCAGAAGQAGDLTISLVKRTAKVKDSGWIVPGHGGLLDRIDGLMMTSAVTWAYTALVLPLVS